MPEHLLQINRDSSISVDGYRFSFGGMTTQQLDQLERGLGTLTERGCVVTDPGIAKYLECWREALAWFREKVECPF